MEKEAGLPPGFQIRAHPETRQAPERRYVQFTQVQKAAL